ncbi:MAG: phenylacetate--CoA ligase family protein [Janthinobacterium lividum]
MDHFPNMPGGFEGVAWPTVTNAGTTPLAALLAQFGRTAGLSDVQLAQAQCAQLAALAAHGWRHAPAFRQRLQAAGLAPHDLEKPGALAALPVLTRNGVQERTGQMHAGHVPVSHLPVGETGTSGSLGQPVIVRRTALNQLFWNAFTLREHLWNRRDFHATLAVIRTNLPKEGVSLPDWGKPVNYLYESGPAHGISSNWPIADQFAWLQRIEPQYLLTYPTNLSFLLDEFERRGASLPSLRQVRTLGETVTPALRRRVREMFGVGIADTYSSQELGTIAIQALDADGYHVMAEGYIAEVLDAHDQPCAPGTIGRLILTDLHNYAMPLVRYDTGDYAELATPSRGPHGLPVLNRVMGRKRNMIVIDGSRRWPTLHADLYRHVAPIRQYQLVQQTPDSIEVRLVCEPMSAVQEARLAAIIHEALDHPFTLRFCYFDTPLPLGKTGKFEEFVCLVE